MSVDRPVRHLPARDIPIPTSVTEAAGHGGFFGMAPEDDDMIRLTREFIEQYGRP